MILPDLAGVIKTLQEELERVRCNWNARDGPYPELVEVEVKHPCKPMLLRWETSVTPNR